MNTRPRLTFSHGLSQPLWLTVMDTIPMPDGSQRLQVRCREVSGQQWLAPYLPVSVGTAVRGWLEPSDSSECQVVWDAPRASGRLITVFLAHAYPMVIVRRIVRDPGVATFIQIHAVTAATRRLCYSPQIRERLHTLFYKPAQVPSNIVELFRLTSDTMPLTAQAAYLLGIPRRRVEEVADHVLQLTRHGIHLASLIPLVEQCLEVQVWTPDTLPKTR